MRFLVQHMLHDSACNRPHHEAFTEKDQKVLYGDASQTSKAIGECLRQLGISRGDRIGVQLPPGINLPLSLMGIACADAVFVPIHHGLYPNQVAHILRDCGAIAFISDHERLTALEESHIPLENLRHCLIHDDGSSQADQIPTLPKTETHRIADLITASVGSFRESENIGKDLAAILYTSGSTGAPKGVMLSHDNLVAGAEIVADYLKIDKNERILAALPLSFDAGLNQLTTAILRGATTRMISFRFGREIVRSLADDAITGLAGVPSLWNLLSRPSSGLGKQPLPSLRYITNTGGAMPQNVLRDLRQQLPKTEVFLMYGLTEAFRSTYLPPDQLDQRPTSMGKPIPNTKIFVVNDHGQECAPDEVGELVHHGPTVSLGYWGHPELTDKVLRPHPFPNSGGSQSDRVCYSGDLVRRDNEGYLYFVGRRDNQIKSSGFRISPTEVEDVITKMENITQSAVIGVPDDVLGQHLVAFVIAAEGAGTDPEDVITHCAGMLPRHMIPKRVEIVTDLPSTSSGKVDYPALREHFAQSTPTSAECES